MSAPPFPGIPLASMNRISPPLGVHARPVETPGTPVRSASSRKKRDGPRRSEIALGSTTVESFPPSARRRATFRQMAAISRSRLRRPASRV